MITERHCPLAVKVRAAKGGGGGEGTAVSELRRSGVRLREGREGEVEWEWEVMAAGERMKREEERGREGVAVRLSVLLERGGECCRDVLSMLSKGEEAKRLCSGACCVLA